MCLTAMRGAGDILFGYSGDDVYWLGRGTGHDVVIEFFRNYREDTGDVIKVKSGDRCKRCSVTASRR